MTHEDPAINDLHAWSAAHHALRVIPPGARRATRENAGISRAVLADVIGVSWDRVRSYEEGSNPSGENAYLYHQALVSMQGPAVTMLDDDQRADIQARFDAYQADYPVMVCQHCGGIHPRACPRVKRVVYHPDNQRVAEVEYWPDGEWPKDHIIFPDSPEMV